MKHEDKRKRWELTSSWMAQNASELVVRIGIDYRINYINPAGERVLEAERSQIIGKDFFDFFNLVKSSHMESRIKNLFNAQGSLISKDEVIFCEGTFLNPKRQKRCVEWKILPMVVEGERVEVICFGIDKTYERERINALINEKIAMQDRSRAKSDFLSSTSHELRTPLNAVIGYSEMLLEEAQEIGADSLISDLNKIKGAGKHLLALINDVLDLSKIEAGKIELHNETFDVITVVLEVAATLESLVQKNFNTFKINYTHDLQPIFADRTKVRQILLNILSNSAKFTEKGTVTLTVFEEEKEGGDWIVFEVEDTGIGMSEDEVKALFQPYFQIESPLADRNLGTGLGLVISRRFCELMGGAIHIESQHEKGTKVRIELPLQGEGVKEHSFWKTHPTSSHLEKANDVSETADEMETGREKSQSILVIDDDLVMHDLMRRLLESQGFTMVSALSGEEGFRLAKEIQPRAITLDLFMPKMNGWETLKKLKQDPELSSIPVIILTISSEGMQEHPWEIEEYLVKPIDGAYLAHVLKKYRKPKGEQKLLVVDDDQVTQEVVCTMAKKQGWYTRSAENGKVALEAVKKEPPNLILLDLMMPVMNGFEFLEAFKKTEHWKTTHVVILTAKSLTEEEKRSIFQSAGSILGKDGGGYGALEKLIKSLASGE